MAVAACGACRGNYGRGGTCGTSERVRPWWRMWVARIDQPPGTCISSPASDLIPLNSAPPPLVADCELIPDACQCEGGAVARCTGGPSAKCGRMRRSALGFSHSWLRKYKAVTWLPGTETRAFNSHSTYFLRISTHMPHTCHTYASYLSLICITLVAQVNTESLESAAEKYKDFREPPAAALVGGGGAVPWQHYTVWGKYTLVAPFLPFITPAAQATNAAAFHPLSHTHSHLFTLHPSRTVSTS